jgi:hypothetical protein
MPLDPRSLVPVLRRRFHRHNWQVLGLSALSLAVAMALWGLLFLVAYWLLLLLLSSVIGGSARVPRGFGYGFIAVSASLVLVAWVDRKMFPDRRPPDNKSATEIFGDFLLAIPRLTLTVPGTLSAWLRLSAADLAQAAQLLIRIVQERKMPLHAAPAEIPDDRVRERVIFALLMLKILELRRVENVTWLYLTGTAKKWVAALEQPADPENSLPGR